METKTMETKTKNIVQESNVLQEYRNQIDKWSMYLSDKLGISITSDLLLCMILFISATVCMYIIFVIGLYDICFFGALFGVLLNNVQWLRLQTRSLDDDHQWNQANTIVCMTLIIAVLLCPTASQSIYSDFIQCIRLVTIVYVAWSLINDRQVVSKSVLMTLTGFIDRLVQSSCSLIWFENDALVSSAQTTINSSSTSTSTSTSTVNEQTNEQ
jgi:hypothetical protein